MYWLDTKYLGMLSSQLPLYEVKSSNPFKASCRCPVCGDSKKNQYKKRGHFYRHKDIILFKCFNCGVTKSVGSLLKLLNPDLKKEYDLECFSETERPAPEPEVIKHEYISSSDYNTPLKKLKKISQLPAGHPAKVYVEKRLIPSSQHFRLYYAPKFFTWTNSIIPNKFDFDKDEPRLVLPFLDKDGNMFGYQARSFDPASKLRYISVMVRGDHTKIFGLDQIDFTKTVYVVEGPIDSLFLPNCLAMAGADVSLGIFDKEKTVIIYDNERRNSEMLQRVEKTIDQGFKIVLWPESIVQKDINDMVKSGIPVNKVLDIIKENTYGGLEAKLKLAEWRRV